MRILAPSRAPNSRVLSVCAAAWCASTAAAAAEVCTDRFPIGALASELDQSEAAYSSLDEAAFDRAVHKAALITRCLNQPITPLLAARLHWVSGLQMYLQREPQRAAFALAAARGLGDTWTLPTTVVPKGHELWELYAQQSVRAELAPQPSPKDGALWFDGAESIERPTDRATVVQHVGSDQQVRLTRYLLPGQGMPDYGADVTSPHLGGGTGGGGVANGRTRARLVNPWLAAGAGVAAGGAIASWLVGRNAESNFNTLDPSYTLDDLDGYRSTANAGGAMSMGLGVAAAGLGATAFFVGVW